MEHDGIKWKVMESHGKQWNFRMNLMEFWDKSQNFGTKPLGTLGPISWKLIEAHGIPWNLMELPEHSMAFSSEKVFNKLTYSSKDKRPPLPFGTLTLRQVPLYPLTTPFPPPIPLSPTPTPFPLSPIYPSVLQNCVVE